MNSGRVVALRPIARVAAVASALAVVAILLLPNAAFADTGIGSPIARAFTCGVGLDTVQMTSVGPSYAVPAGGGFITSWTTQALTTGAYGPVGLEVWRPTAIALSYQLVAISPMMTLAPGIVNTFQLATQIPVNAGDLIGLRLDGPMTCSQVTSNLGDTYGYAAGVALAAGGIQTFTAGAQAQLNIAANVSATAPGGGGGCDSTGASTGDDQCDGNKHCDSAESSHRECVQHGGEGDGQDAPKPTAN
jgi:hypothetical protein